MSRINILIATPSPLAGQVLTASKMKPGDTTNGTVDIQTNGTLAAMSGSYALGTSAPNEKHRFKFTDTLNSSANSNYQGDSSTAAFQWDAVQ